MIKQVGFFSTMAAMLLASTVALAESGTERLNKFMKKAKTVEATFTQEVVSEQGQIIQTALGKFYLKRPGKFRWEYQSPTPQLIVGDGKKLWVYDKDLEQVTVKPMKKALGSSPAAILMRKHDLNDDYLVLERSPREGMLWVDLRPKKKNGDFKRILIGLDDIGVQAMDLYDQFGQITMIRFQESDYNKPLKDSLFKFKPPAGADVIGQ